jgi:predicted SPOUT superfamily RNA methylase MTH1
MENEWLKYLERRNSRIISIYGFSTIVLYKDESPGRSETTLFRILLIYIYVHIYILV